MSVKDLINAIASGSAIETQTTFNQVMAEKISARLDDMRVDVAQSMFATEEVELDEEQLDELSKTTLGSYVNKSKGDQSDRKASFRKRDDMEPIEHDDGSETEKGAELRKIENRGKGIKTAVKKLSKEEYEEMGGAYTE